MNLSKLLLLWLLFIAPLTASGQALDQPNIGFEAGNTSVWKYTIGHCCPLVLDTALPAAIPNRHTVTSGTAVDPYGRFPVVSPGGGNYSLRLGNDNVNAQAERAEYQVHVPSGLTNYSLVFRYAVVFEDPGHPDMAQPRFAVNAYDSVSGTPIECAQYLYISSSKLPGFKTAKTDGGDTSDVKYKEWTTASINLSGYSGKTITIDVTSGDCAYGGHFGYGYFDISGGLFAVSIYQCNKLEAKLQGPGGYDRYLWYDSLFTTLLDSNVIGTLPNPTQRTTYALVLQPYPGYGCPDTLFTTIYPSQLSLIPQHDLEACLGTTVRLSPSAENAAGPIKFSWDPAPGVSCTSCTSISPIVGSTSVFIVTISDTSGCFVTDTIHIKIDTCALAVPNAFTPNGDGKNDIFRVLGVGFEYYNKFSLSVFNRFGQRVFFSKDIYAGWDGVFNGIPQDLGTYFYMVLYTLNGEEHLQKGDVTLVR
jgi:gliding motility-associated-like protein